MATRKALLRDIVGSRGENKLELCLTDYEHYDFPLFKPGFLGDKWPVVDFYVELLRSRQKCFFFAQAKATSSNLGPNDAFIRISSKRGDIRGLKKIPGPTYIFGIHEPSGRVFIRCVHSRTPIRAITRIPVANELTPARLMTLHQEVRGFWQTNDFKPTTSAFL
jgi:hypothetical protein